MSVLFFPVIRRHTSICNLNTHQQRHPQGREEKAVVALLRC